MKITVIKNRLRAARRLWARGDMSADVNGLPGFVSGVMRGLKEALIIIQDSQCEDIRTTKANRKPLTRWTAMRLYKACRHAANRLKEGDRRGALQILQTAMNQVAVEGK